MYENRTALKKHFFKFENKINYYRLEGYFSTPNANNKIYKNICMHFTNNHRNDKIFLFPNNNVYIIYKRLNVFLSLNAFFSFLIIRNVF